MSGPAKPRLTVAFADLCSNPQSAIDQCLELLRMHYDVEVVRHRRPDVLFYSFIGFEHLRYGCRRIFYTGENQRPPWRACDFALTMDFDPSPRHFRVPHFLLYPWVRTLAPKPTEGLDAVYDRPRFCTFVVSNPNCAERDRFFHLLSEYRKVDSGGRHLNNVGGRVPDKHAFLREGRFHLAFENSSHPGYTTEKIADAMHAQAIPIYWGNPDVGRDFNKASFVDVLDYDSFDRAVDAVIRLDQDRAAFEAMLREPWFTGDAFPEAWSKENLALVLKRAIEMPRAPRAPAAVAAQWVEGLYRMSRRRLRIWVKGS